MSEEKRDQQDKSYEFLRETIKEKPVDKRKIVRQIGRLVGMGAVFGFTAAVVFAVTAPKLVSKVQEKYNASKVQFLSEEEKTEEKSGQTQAEEDAAGVKEDTDAAKKDSDSVKEDADAAKEDTDVVKAEQPPVTEPPAQQTTIVQELTPEGYKELHRDIFSTADQAKKSMVTVIGSQNDEDWFQTPYESQISGLLVAESGQDFYVLTEYRIVENVDRIQVVFCDGTMTDARFLNADSNTGFAVLKIPKAGISPSTKDTIAIASLGESHNVKQGEPVLAIGSPMGYSDSVGYGIVTSTSHKVSKVDTEYGLLTTDITGSRDGSGIILNLEGKIVGIISQSFAKEDMKNMVTGLLVSQIRELIQFLSDDSKDMIYMGITGENITLDISEKKGIPVGVFVENVEVDSPAMQVGIQNGDVIVELNGEKVETVRGYQQLLKSCRDGQNIKVKAMRQGTEGYVEVSFLVTLKVR